MIEHSIENILINLLIIQVISGILHAVFIRSEELHERKIDLVFFIISMTSFLNHIMIVSLYPYIIKYKPTLFLFNNPFTCYSLLFCFLLCVLVLPQFIITKIYNRKNSLSKLIVYDPRTFPDVEVGVNALKSLAEAVKYLREHNELNGGRNTFKDLAEEGYKLYGNNKPNKNYDK